jgi:hypothetical protein
MPASTNAALLDYETNIEDALATYLDGAITSTQVLTTRTLLTSDEILTTPRITVAVQIAGTNPSQQATKSSYAGDYDSHKLGTVSLVATMRRNASGQGMTALRGGIRAAMIPVVAALNGTNLPYYQILTLREGSCSTSFNADNDEIVYALTYALEFYIKPDQWAS